MSLVSLSQSPAVGAYAQAGLDMLQAMCNAQVSAGLHTFGVLRHTRPTVVQFQGAAAHSRSVQVDGAQADVDGAAYALVPDATVTMDSADWRIVDRVDLTDLGQVCLLLEPVL